MKIKVWKEKEKEKDTNLVWTLNMWCGSCTCGSTWQFWAFGATLGFGLEHLRRCGR